MGSDSITDDMGVSIRQRVNGGLWLRRYPLWQRYSYKAIEKGVDHK
jgi:hypothetical protein